MDLSQAANLAGISIDELYKLNPGYNRWATVPNDDHHLVIPLEKIEIFKEKLSQLPQDARIGWERYKIVSGDSLIKIANKFNTDVATLKSVNNIRSNNIRAGDALMIPVAKQPLNQYTHSQAQRTNRKQSSSPSNKTQKTIYTVRAGDSFWSIAKKYNVKVRTLASWNAMAPTDPLQINKKLVVWSSEKVTASGNPLALNLHNDKVRKVNYRVRSGDSLARIAQKFNLTVREIKKWNQVAHKKYLQPGDRLTLFVNVTNLN
jgi:membrane-bound lytic murein transglycosylase D